MEARGEGGLVLTTLLVVLRYLCALASAVPTGFGLFGLVYYLKRGKGVEGSASGEYAAALLEAFLLGALLLVPAAWVAVKQTDSVRLHGRVAVGVGLVLGIVSTLLWAQRLGWA